MEPVDLLPQSKDQSCSAAPPLFFAFSHFSGEWVLKSQEGGGTRLTEVETLRSVAGAGGVSGFDTLILTGSQADSPRRDNCLLSG